MKEYQLWKSTNSTVHVVKASEVKKYKQYMLQEYLIQKSTNLHCMCIVQVPNMEYLYMRTRTVYLQFICRYIVCDTFMLQKDILTNILDIHTRMSTVEQIKVQQCMTKNILYLLQYRTNNTHAVHSIQDEQYTSCTVYSIVQDEQYTSCTLYSIGRVIYLLQNMTSYILAVEYDE